MTTAAEAPPGLDALAALVRDCMASGVARRALLLRTDLLPPLLSRPHHMRLARAALDPLASADRARLHDLAAGRVAISWRGDAPTLLRRSLDALEHLLQDAPLDAPGLPELVRLFDLPQDGAALLLAANAPTRRDRPIVALASAIPPPPLPLQPLDPVALLALEDRLASADLARFVRRRPVHRLGNGTFQQAWDARTLSLPELMEAVSPGHDALADPWLHRRLTRLLDRRMLALLSNPAELHGGGPFSLDLNVSSIVGPDFVRFDAALPGALRNRFVLNLRADDIIQDPAGFAFARNFARARGYRVLLQDVPAALLPALHLPALDLDYVQLRWSPALAALDLAATPRGAARWVLGRADTAAALDWGWAQGVGLFQGAAVTSAEGPAAAPSQGGAAGPNLRR